MNDYPLPGIVDFLSKVVPFNTLPPPVLHEVITATQVAFYPAGQRIICMGEPTGEILYVVQTGCARVTITDESGEELLVDFRGEGDSFGAVSLIKGGNALFNVKAEEDLIVFLISKAAVDNLLKTHSPFRSYFGFSLARNFKAVRKSADEQLDLLTRDSQAHVDTFMTGKRVRDLMSTMPLSCRRQTPVREAAGMMKQRGVGSIVVVNPDGMPEGILTDADLRSKIIADGRSLDTPVSQVMSTPIRTVSPRAFSFDALLDMSHFGVSHLIVTDKKQAVGMISEHDFQLASGSSPIGMIGDITRAVSIPELVDKRAHIDRVLEMAMQRSGSIKPMVALIAELNDRVTRQFIRVIEREMATEGFGPPPAPYCWLAMGSEGRQEQTLCTDQDNALVYADVSEADDPSVQRWFLELSKRVVDALDRFGIPKCRGGIMASNPQWCMDLSHWQRMFANWISDPTPDSLRMASIFFDFRAITTDFDGARTLKNALTRMAVGKKHFARVLAKNALNNRPPLGFLRQFVVEKSGEHNNGLNLKLRGLTPVVDVARVLALELGVASTNTLERLKAATGKKVLRPDFFAAIDDAYDYINFIRIDHHLKSRDAGTPMNNFVDPALLNPMERKVLKESFTVISQLQELMAGRYQSWRVKDR
jgi:CBS domain-containing protein